MTNDHLKKPLPVPALSQAKPLPKPASPPRFPLVCASFLTGFLLGGASFPPDTYPAGLALVAALPSYSLFAALGVLLRSILDLGKDPNALMFGVAALLVAVLRTLFGVALDGKRCLSPGATLPDTIPIRALLAAVFALGTSLLRALFSELALYDILTFLAGTVSTVAFTFLLAFFFDRETQQTPAFEAGFGAAAFLLALSLSDVTINGFSVGLTVSFALTLYAGYLGQPTRSAAVGLLCGLACGGAYAPVFALSGLVAGIFFEVNGLLAAAGAVAVLLCGAFYFGETAEALSYLPEVVVSTVLVVLPAALRILPSFSYKEHPQVAMAEADRCSALAAQKRDELRDHRMARVADSMNELSAILHGLSEGGRRPEPEKLTEKCIAVFRKHCRNCSADCSCRDLSSLEKETLQKRFASRLMTYGKIDREHLYEITKAKCPKLDEIAAEIGDTAGKMLSDAIREDKTRIFAFDYEAMAEMFADAAAEGTVGFDTDKVLSDRVRRRLYQIGFSAENIVVCGDRKKYVIATGADVALSTHTPSQVRALLESVCGIPFREPEYLIENGKSALVAESAPAFAVEYTGRQARKKGELLCGDSVSSFCGDDDLFYSFICDGMGSGKEAALTSHLCRVFLEKMLACGNKHSTTLEMLNRLLLAQRTECFATVDLLEIDLSLGIASFIKSGAVPSYILRAGRIFKISSGTLPLGIIEDAAAELTEFELQDGDTVVLCSDGIASDIEASSSDDPAWFLEFLEGGCEEDLDRMAERILDAAECAAVRPDDMTVELIRIRKLPAARTLAS